jgi:hypothetical protein
MKSDTPYRVFISYTGQDLEAHAEVVSDMVKRLNSDTSRSFVAIDHKFWAPTGRPSVKECMEHVERCQILIVLVAFRYGWVPSREEGGDGEFSITRLEVERARAAGLEVIPFLVEDNAHWSIADVEGLTDPKAQERLDRFKADLRKSLAGFFETPKSLEAPTVLALNKAAERIERSRVTPRRVSYLKDRADEADFLVPSYFDPDHPPTLEERLETQLPKRILSLDSGGVRTAIVLGYLERLEQLLRVRYGDADFRLSDYFDLIGASGASAIIAAELARGRNVAEARKTFVDAIEAMMSSKSLFRMGLFGALYRPDPLLRVLHASFGDMVLRSEELKTGLGIVLTRIDTGEIWSLTNHPRIRSSERGGLPLSQVLLASVSTPVFLPPVVLRFASDSGSYLSGEISVGPDPALHLFLVATGPAFPFRWRTGRRRIFLASIGAGAPPVVKREPNASPIQSMIQVTSSMVAGLKQQSDLALAALTHEDTRELSTSMRDDGAVETAPSILRYRRFDVVLDAPTLKKIGLSELGDDLDSIVRMDRADQIGSHLEIGRRAGERDLDDGFFSLSFDVRPRARGADG